MMVSKGVGISRGFLLRDNETKDYSKARDINA